MASGDTKTEALLSVLGNGGSVEGITGCCNTKTQTYIIDAINRIQGVESEVEELKNNPDVVDIVNTYADLQAYDTQHLTENDIVRVLQDETHDGNSTYYRFTKNPDTWTFIGEISGGGGGDSSVHVLTQDDYNYPVDNPTGVAVYALEDGLYYAPFGVNYSYVSGNSVIYTSVRSAFLIVRKSSDTQGLVIRFSPEGFWGNTGDSSGATKLLGTAYQIEFNTSTLAPTTIYNKAGFVTTLDVVNNLVTTSTRLPLSANQGKVLNDKITPSSGSGAPTTSTVGELGKIYIDTSTDAAYMCTKVNGSTYTWKQITS